MVSVTDEKLTRRFVFTAIITSALAISLTPSYAQHGGGGSHGGGGAGGGCGDSGGDTGCSGDEGGGHKGGRGGHRGSNDMGPGNRGQSLRGVFHEMDRPDRLFPPGGDEHSRYPK